MVSINAGSALGGAILGITPGGALEKKSVRDIAANFASNKIGELNFSLHESKVEFMFPVYMLFCMI